MRRWITLIVGLLISAVTLYFAFRNTNLAEVELAVWICVSLLGLIPVKAAMAPSFWLRL